MNVERKAGPTGLSCTAAGRGPVGRAAPGWWSTEAVHIRPGSVLGMLVDQRRTAATTIPTLPESIRPRERLWARGVDALSTTELLALILRCGCPGESAVDLAASLLTEYHGLSGLAASRPEELAARRGVGVAKAAAILAAVRLGRLLDSEASASPCRTAADLAKLVRPHLGDLRHERTLVVILDAGHRLRRIVTLTDGSVDRSLLPVREV